MKVFFVASVGRQVQGEMITLRFDGCFSQASRADEFAKGLAKVFTETITTPHGPLEFLCERSVHEVEVEE